LKQNCNVNCKHVKNSIWKWNVSKQTMSNKHCREEARANASKNLSVANKCVAIVLSQNDGDADQTVVDPTDGNIIQSSEVHKALWPNGFNGKQLLQDFKIRNKTCYWNPSLVESIRSLEYKGFFEPSTILVSAADIHLENLRSAWGRRVLKAPGGFSIERIGDVAGIQMQVIPQTQFTPLPDCICSIIQSLNARRLPATMEVIIERLDDFRDMTPPSEHVVFDTLAGLIRDRKVFHTGSGYFVVTPDTNRLSVTNSSNSTYCPTNASWLPYHPMYVPVFQGQMTGMAASRAHMRSISCQVTTIEESEESSEEKELTTVTKESQVRAPRSNSLGRDKNKKETKVVKETGEFKRSSSVKCKKDKVKEKVEESIKPSHPEKEKEKSSIFSKIFGRNKKKSKDSKETKDTELMPPPMMPPPPPPTKSLPPPPPSVATFSSSDTASSTGKGKEGKDKEYATFSAQFPPPEWVWYQQQQEKQNRTDTWVSQQSLKPPAPSTRGTLVNRPPTGPKHISSSARKSLYQPHMEYMPMSAVSSHLAERKPLQGINEDGCFQKPKTIRSDNFYESGRHHPSGSKHRHHRKSRDFDRGSEYDVIDTADTTPMHESNVYNSTVSGLSPVAPFTDDSVYAKLVENPKLGPLHSTPRCGETNIERSAYGVEGHESRDRIHGPSSSHRRKSRRSRRKTTRSYISYGNGSDISYEYKGRLPGKNSSRVQSQNSGINCVGLAANDKNQAKSSGSAYENIPQSSRSQHGNRQNQNPTPVPFRTSNVPFELHSTAIGDVDVTADHSQMSCMTDPAFNSIAYQSSMNDPAYNSVVYGSMGGPSIMYHTMAASSLEMSGIPGNGAAYQSIQSGFYDDSNVQTNAVTCQVEINPNAPHGVEELHSGSPDADSLEIDVVGLPDSQGPLSGSYGDLATMTSEGHHQEHSEKEPGFGSNDGVNVTTLEKGLMSGRPVLPRRVPSSSEDGGSSVINLAGPSLKSTDDCANTKTEAKSSADKTESASKGQHRNKDSGFSSPPSNPAVCSNSSNSEQCENSDPRLVHRYQTSSSSDAGHPSQDGSSSSSQAHTHTSEASDIHMVSGGEQHVSREAADIVECSDDVDDIHHLPKFTHNFQIRSMRTSQSMHSLKGSSHSLNHHNLHPQQFHHSTQNRYSTAYQSGNIVTHPDVYNNNNAVQVPYMQGNRVPLHPSAVVNAQRPLSVRSNRIERPRSEIPWKNHQDAQSDLHTFEEEQLSKKYGVNGEFEVMGVL